MANTKNLRPIKLSHEEAIKNGRKGGKKSAENRRKAKTIKQCIQMFVNLEPNEKVVKQLKSVGIDEENANYMMAMVVGVSQRAMKGDSKAFKIINEYLGEDAKLKLETKKSNKEMSLREKEYELRERELRLREEEFAHRKALDNGEVKQEDRVIIVNDLDEFELQDSQTK